MFMMKKRWLLFCACVCLLTAGAQKQIPGDYQREISLVTENDAYLGQQKDAYYTNGFFVSFRNLSHAPQKKLQQYETGQMIYTPLIRKTLLPADIDRPYCGYLYFQYNEEKFSRKDAVLQYWGRIDVVGEASFGESVQNSYHRLLHYSRFTGWAYQVQNALGADMGISYAGTLLEDSSWIKLVPVGRASLGTSLTFAGIGSYLCIGSFEKNANSAMWNARIQNQPTRLRRKHESYFFWYPELLIQGYNATIQGGLFAKGEGAVLGEPQRWMFQQTFGVCYAADRWTAQLAYVHQTKEAITQTRDQDYGSIKLSYRMH